VVEATGRDLGARETTASGHVDLNSEPTRAEIRRSCPWLRTIPYPGVLRNRRRVSIVILWFSIDKGHRRL